MNIDPSARTYRVLVAAGGTGGHIVPALAVARLLRERSKDESRARRAGEIVFLGTNKGLEARLITDFPLREVAAAGLKGLHGTRLLRNAMALPASAIRVWSILSDVSPDLVIGLGGYAAGPAMLLAALRNIPTLLIEPNAIPGFTNRALKPFVRAAAVGFEETAKYYGPKAMVTGHPIRKAFFDVPAKEHRPPLTIAVFGGSQGAHAINEAVVNGLEFFKARNVTFIHQTGERDAEWVRQAYRDRGMNSEVSAFLDDVPGVFARADLVISRAGAMTVAEITGARRASLLIPFPGAADQHQMVNARTLERLGAARVLPQKDLTGERLASEALDLLADPTRLEQMEQAAGRLARRDAAERIADLAESLV